MTSLTPPTVGIVSSIPVPLPFQRIFNSAYKANYSAQSPYAIPTYQDDKGFDPSVDSPLWDAFDFFNNTQPVGLIVTVGGLIPYNCATAYAAAAIGSGSSPVPFLSLVGAVPASISSKCYGGVSLESWVYDEDRVVELIQNHGFSGKANSIKLYYNQYSGMQADEVSNWQNKIARDHAEVDPNPVRAMLHGNNNSNDYTTTVDSIPSPGGVVVSADPFFNKTKDKLIQALNTKFVAKNATNYVCYPLYDYENSNPPPTPGHATLLGPRLGEAVAMIGILAGLTVSSGNLNLRFWKGPLGNPKAI